MCQICRKYKCTSACPEYVGNSAEWGAKICECRVCGLPLRKFEDVKYSYGNPYCNACYMKMIRGRKNAKNR